jgi:hypothetical protein
MLHSNGVCERRVSTDLNGGGTGSRGALSITYTITYTYNIHWPKSEKNKEICGFSITYTYNIHVGVYVIAALEVGKGCVLAPWRGKPGTAVARSTFLYWIT